MKVTLLNSPLRITYYFSQYLLHTTTTFISQNYYALGISTVLLSISLYYNSQYYLYWIILGIASSVGLGTGLHTFVLFLAPFIAQTAIQYSSNNHKLESINGGNIDLLPNSIIKRIIIIYSQVYLEVFCWGFGTALGELPPYFVSRGAYLLGENSITTDIMDLKRKSNRTWWEQGMIITETMVKRLGFWGVLIFASVPNPLFDLAGIMCGRFGIEFWSFFGAVFIGKALIKATIQVINC